jgi:SAM-dependent methyltransferase
VIARDPYDQVPYTDHAYAESHPDRLSVVARFAGWVAPPLTTSRILELGCGRGGNLLPMAVSLPDATLVGVDRAAVQIDEAARIAGAIGQANVRFQQASVEAFDPQGPFDFVICHGLCSWVPPSTRRALLALVARSLAPGGVAYVSFNVLPGWYERFAARDFLLAFPGENPSASLAWLRDAVSPELSDYRRRLAAVVARLEATEPAYARHEYLAEEHHPQRVTDFLREAGHAGLTYLGDAIPSETALELLPEAVAERARHAGTVDAEQLIDFVRCTAFRRALLVRSVDARQRGWTRAPHLDPRAFAGLRIASRLRPHTERDAGAGSERFDGPDGMSVLQSHTAVRAALRVLAAAAPRSLPFPELARAARCEGAGEAEALRAELFDLWLATGAIDLHAYEPRIGDGVAERPVASGLARWRAEHGGALTNLWHQEVQLDDRVLHEVLRYLDGTRSAADIARELGARGPAVMLDAEARLTLARAGVRALAASALLMP